MKFDLQSRWWGTYRQWSDKGCMVKRRPDDVRSGEWGCSSRVRKARDQEEGERRERESKTSSSYFKQLHRILC